jgi:hypothetical protein
MRRALLSTLVIVAALQTPAVARAAVTWEVQASHSPSAISRGDEYMTYAVSIKNVGDANSAGAVTVDFALPAGVRPDLEAKNGTGWSCSLLTHACSNSASVSPGASLPILSMPVFLDPEIVPDVLDATFTASGGGASAAASGEDSFALGPPLSFGLIPDSFIAKVEDEAGDDYTQAGGHPFRATAAFDFVKKNARERDSLGNLLPPPFEDARDAVINLPPGFAANTTVIPGGCRVSDVAESNCPERYAIGRAFANLGGFTEKDPEAVVYKVEAGAGYPAAFAFRPVGVSNVTVLLRPKIRPGDFTVAAFSPSAPQNPHLFSIEYFTFCSYGAVVKAIGPNWFSPRCKNPTDTGALAKPFITNPTRCTGEEDVSSINVASYQNPGAFDDEGYPDLTDPNWKTYETTSPPLTGCNQLPFDPSFEGRPSTNVADAPTGLDFNLHIPQDGLVDPEGLGSAHLKDTTVVLPRGMTVNPSAATGLEACSTAQIGLLETEHAEPYRIRFDGKPIACPDASRIGTVTVNSPLIDETLQGGVYLAKQFDNPFGSLLALYLVIRNDQIGLSAKLAGEVTPDPVTGQLTVHFEENPQLPFEDLRLKSFEGPRASLRTPATCGLKTTEATFNPWSAPESGPPATPNDSFQIATAPGGGKCATKAADLPNAPRLLAGTMTPKAGAYSPFVFRLSREDGSQELKGLTATLPPGLTGRLAGVPFCSQAGINRAAARKKPGQGALELRAPSCPAASQVGTVAIAAGAGPLPYRTEGKVYLAGPYKGAPVSLVVITPAVAGPFDLGVVVVRNALRVDPVTAQVSVESDPLPTILDGIPLDLRSIEVRVTRDRFTLNPTSCEPMSIGATAQGLSSLASLSQRFQVGECDGLGFKPHLKLTLVGGTRRGAHPALTAVLTPRPGDANISSISVALPHSEFLEQGHIRTICTRVQFAANQCPAGAVYGEAEATTPLLDQPLKGPVYLRSSDNPLPDLVVALRGPDSLPIEVQAAGRIDSVRGGIRNSFELVPDAPITRFVLRMQGGKKGLLVNSRQLCRGKVQSATVRAVAHNGKRRDFSPVLHNKCGKGKKQKRT